LGTRRSGWISDAIISAHHKWGISGRSSLEQVTLVAFNPRDMGNLTEMLRVYNIPFRVEEKEGSEEDMMEGGLKKFIIVYPKITKVVVFL